ncbi:MAG: LysR family transcriptional regulator [Myxococcales bacterium]
MFEWSDLKYFLAVAREGSTLAAAKLLGVNQSTVQRRLGALEAALGKPLAVRHPTGYRLTEFGARFLPYAVSVEDAVLAAHIAARAFDARPSGIIRFTCPEPVLGRLAATGVFERFRALHPGLTLDLQTADRYLDLWRGEADVALRSGDPGDARLVGRRVADSYWAVYASRSYLEQHARPVGLADLAQHAWVAFEGPMENHRANVWLKDVLPQARIVARNASVLGVLATVKAGVGVGALPVGIASAEESLAEILPVVPELTRGWYLLTRPDLRIEPHVNAFFAFVIAEALAVREAVG